MSISTTSAAGGSSQTTVERTQTGIRMDRTLLKVLKGLAEYLDLSLADLLEGQLLHALEGQGRDHR